MLRILNGIRPEPQAKPPAQQKNGRGATLAAKQLTCSTRPLINGVFVCCRRNRMALLPTQAFYLLINNSGLASMSLTMAQVYKDHQDDDGFLYMTYASQEMFGR